MKKSIIAIAVSSAALASVSVHAAEGSTVNLYGNIQYYYYNADDGSELQDGGSALGLNGETVVNDDLTAFFNVKYKLKADEKKSESVTLDNAFVGLKGGFGTLKIGTFDSIYNDAIQDPIDQFDQLGFTNNRTTTEGDTIAYFSPTMSGFQAQISAQYKGDDEDFSTTDEDSNEYEVTDGTAVTAVIKYSADALTVAAGYDSLANTLNDDTETTGLSIGYDVMPNLNVTVKYETTSDVQDAIGISTRYGYGMGDIYASYQTVSPDAAGSDDYDEYAMGISYDVASNIYVFGEVGSFGNEDNSDTDTQTAVGLYYGF